jgi:hypothetical protein
MPARFSRVDFEDRVARSNFFDLNDGLALIGPAIQAGVMRQLEFMTLRTDRHPRWGDPQFLCPSLVASRSGMLMFWIRHGSSSNSRHRRLSAESGLT